MNKIKLCILILCSFTCIKLNAQPQALARLISASQPLAKELAKSTLTGVNVGFNIALLGGCGAAVASLASDGRPLHHGFLTIALLAKPCVAAGAAIGASRVIIPPLIREVSKGKPAFAIGCGISALATHLYDKKVLHKQTQKKDTPQ
jgi:hypothetical protein